MHAYRPARYRMPRESTFSNGTYKTCSYVPGNSLRLWGRRLWRGRAEPRSPSEPKRAHLPVPPRTVPTPPRPIRGASCHRPNRSNKKRSTKKAETRACSSSRDTPWASPEALTCFSSRRILEAYRTSRMPPVSEGVGSANNLDGRWLLSRGPECFPPTRLFGWGALSRRAINAFSGWCLGPETPNLVGSS